MIYFCCDRRRRQEVDAHPTLNGIDYLEVLDSDAPVGSPRQQTLLVRCLKPLPAFDRDNVEIEGGERIRPVKTVWAVRADLAAGSPATPAEQAFLAALDEPTHVLVVRTDSAGDYSTYRLVLRTSALDDAPPADFDPRLATIEFSFKVECPSDFDCKPQRPCPPETGPEPPIDYLAKDYASFRRLMLDRMAALTPQWSERNAADLGVTLVELFAYVGDHLSYQQDAVATEAYLGTARRRISVRRHARLVDYFISDGRNARCWVQVEVSANIPGTPATPALPQGTKLLTQIPGLPTGALADDPEVYGQAEVIFETMEPVHSLFTAHNELSFYPWSDRECCLPRGATAATLQGNHPNLDNNVLVFEEVRGPESGHPEDANPEKRHAVRLIEVITEDAGGQPLRDPLNDEPITEIRWAEDDALPFPFCISAITSVRHGSRYVDNVSVARGNIVLADHGLTIQDEALGSVPEATVFRPPEKAEDPCRRQDPEAIPPRFRPRLLHAPITQVGPYDSTSARAAVAPPSQRDVLPAIVLGSDLDGNTEPWFPVRDLLGSDDDRAEFVAEIESNGVAELRFGDDNHGKRPNAGTEFSATYRVGNGRAGNIGVDSLTHVVTSQANVLRVRNLLPGVGGTEPESSKDARQRAPQAFKTQERAVTEADYAAVTERHDGVQKAAATFRWTGSWHTAFLTVDRFGGLDVTAPFERDIRDHVERFRMAGHDLEVDGPRWVSLEIEVQVCVAPDHFRSNVAAELAEVLGSGMLPDGRRGVFHPDHFTFGQPVYLSRLYEAAQKVPGVASVHVKTFQRQDQPETKALEEGKLPLERLEIARLANDPNFPEHGVLRLELEGGK